MTVDQVVNMAWFGAVFALIHMAGVAVIRHSLAERSRFVTWALAIPVGLCVLVLLVYPLTALLGFDVAVWCAVAGLVAAALSLAPSILRRDRSFYYEPGIGWVGIGLCALLSLVMLAFAVKAAMQNGVWHNEANGPPVAALLAGQWPINYNNTPFGADRPGHSFHFVVAAVLAKLVPSIHFFAQHNITVALAPALNVAALFAVIWRLGRSHWLAFLCTFGFFFGDFALVKDLFNPSAAMFTMAIREFVYSLSAVVFLYVVAYDERPTHGRAALLAVVTASFVMLEDAIGTLTAVAVLGAMGLRFVVAPLWTAYRNNASYRSVLGLPGQGHLVTFTFCHLVVSGVLGNLHRLVLTLSPSSGVASCLGRTTFLTDITFLFPEIGWLNSVGFGLVPLRPDLLWKMAPLVTFGVLTLPFVARQQSHSLIRVFLFTVAMLTVTLNQLVLNTAVRLSHSQQAYWGSLLALLGGFALYHLLRRSAAIWRFVVGPYGTSPAAVLSGPARPHVWPLLAAAVGFLCVAGSAYTFATARFYYWQSIDILTETSDYRPVGWSDAARYLRRLAGQFNSAAPDPLGDRLRAETPRGQVIRALLVNPASPYDANLLSSDSYTQIWGPGYWHDNSFHDIDLFLHTWDRAILDRYGLRLLMLREDDIGGDGPWPVTAVDYRRRQAEARAALAAADWAESLGEVRSRNGGRFALYRVRPPAATPSESGPATIYVGGNTQGLSQLSGRDGPILLAHAPCHRVDEAFRQPERYAYWRSGPAEAAAWMLIDDWSVRWKKLLRVAEAEIPALRRPGEDFFPESLFLTTSEMAWQGKALDFAAFSAMVPVPSTARIDIPFRHQGGGRSVLLAYAQTAISQCSPGFIRVLGNDGGPVSAAAIGNDDNTYHWIALPFSHSEAADRVTVEFAASPTPSNRWPGCRLQINKLAVVPEPLYAEAVARAAAVPSIVLKDR